MATNPASSSPASSSPVSFDPAKASPAATPPVSLSFAQRLIRWQAEHGRHGLPWQQQLDGTAQAAYRVWVSEIMLQQTQVATAIPYYERFMQRFPDVAALAAASSDEVMAHWAGLGYYARARNLHKAAQQLSDAGSELPIEMAALQALPGIGRSTAAAICSLAGEQATPILDGNVKRVLARWAAIAGWPGKASVLAALWQQAEVLMPGESARQYNQALMDLGASICKRSKPLCGECPVAKDCTAHLAGTTAEYPGRKPPKTLPKRSATLLLLRSGEQILLEKRPPLGIWGGLWSLPEFANADEARQQAEQRWGLCLTELEALPTVQHRFSHFEFNMQPLLAALDDAQIRRVAEVGEQQWLVLNEESLAETGTPKPVRDIIRSLIHPNE